LFSLKLNSVLWDLEDYYIMKQREFKKKGNFSRREVVPAGSLITNGTSPIEKRSKTDKSTNEMDIITESVAFIRSFHGMKGKFFYKFSKK